ncbi:MAG: Type and secretion system protein [Pedosphaera sp.]|nr:Type and secretion system protein [Pedosphaera sp.]
MKRNLIVLSLAGLLASSLATLAQTDVPTADKQPSAASTATATNSAPADAAAAPTATAEATSAATPEATPTPTASTAPVAVPTPAAPAAPEATPAPAATNAARDPNAVIPLIVMDEVPLTDAIKNLARQASLNYMLDPKINYGGIGPDGRPVPQPMVSLRWENLTPDQALTAVLNNYNLTIVEDPKTKIARITVKDPAAPDPLVSSIIQLKYADPTNMLVSIQTALVDKRSKVVADTRTAQLVLLATEKEQIEVNKVVAQLDTPTKQVLIEAKLVETSKSPSTSKGIDWSGTFAAQQIRLGNNPAIAQAFSPGTPGTPAIPGTPGDPAHNIPGTPGTPATAGTPDKPEVLSRILNPSQSMFTANSASGVFPSTFFLNADGVSAVLSFLNKDTDARILSTPRAVTLDNQMATLSVTRAQPIFATTAGTQGSPGGSQVSYTNVGTILQVTPRISANNTIQLKVVPEVSDVAGVATKTVAGVVSQADIFDIRRIETQVLIPSGNTLVMGGLVSDATAVGNIKVPLLGDIPLLGHLFRQESKSQDKRNLIIFITPTIVQSEDFQPTQTDFLKSKAPDDKTSDFGAWDSGKPQDWSKLMGKKTDAQKVEDAKFPDVK